MPLPESLDVYNALIYFHAYMYGPLRGKIRLYQHRDLQPRMAMSEDWEIFASILFRNTGAGTTSGLDLEDYEVKSAKDRTAFEYQYHKNSWKSKLDADREAGHIFISHRDELSHVEVRFCEGADLHEYFDKWEAQKPYSGTAQRFRKSVAFGWVRKNATLVLRIQEGEATYEWQPP